jgi:nucleotide-binding universal stress UspA family protein
MGTNRTIVIALDNSIHAKRALEWALENLIQPHDHLILFSISVSDHSVGTWFEHAFGSAPVQNQQDYDEQQAEEFTREMIKSASLICSQFAIKLDGSITLSHEIYGVEANAKQQICDFCKEKKADLLVVGSRGMTGLQKMIGSVSQYCVENASCPVLVVRGD